MLANAETFRAENAGAWRSQLTAPSAPLPPHPLLLESSVPASPAARPAVAFATPLESFDPVLPLSAPPLLLSRGPGPPVAAPECTAATASPRPSLSDTPPPGTGPSSPATVASPPTFFRPKRRLHPGDSLSLSDLTAVACAYSPVRLKAARHAARVKQSTGFAAAAVQVQPIAERDRAARVHLEARAARLEKAGLTVEARRLRREAASIPLPEAALIPHATLPLALPSAHSRVVGSEAADPRAATSPVSYASDELDLTSSLDLLPPGERRARLASIDAACDFVPLLEVWQAALVLGQPMSDVRRSDPRVVTADLVRVFGYGWAAGTINAAAREWRNLRVFAFDAGTLGRPRVLAGREIPGKVVNDFLTARHNHAVAKHLAKYRRLGVEPPRGHAGGHAAKGALATSIKWLKHRAFFRIDLKSTSIARTLETARRSAGAPAPSLNPRNAFCLSEQAEFGVSEFVRGHAAGHYAGVHFALRQVNLQRASLISIQNGVVYGEVDLDAKQKSSQQRARPMWAPERDARGSNAWLRSVSDMLTAPPHAVGEHYLVRRTNSPDGNPFKATAWEEGPESAGRARVSQCAILQAGPFGVSAAVARTLTGHGKKHALPNVGRAIHLPDPQINEIGRWARSAAQRTAASGAPSGEVQVGPCPAAYSTEAAEEVVPKIMETVVAALRNLCARVPAAALPHVGGWSMLRHPDV